MPRLYVGDGPCQYSIIDPIGEPVHSESVSIFEPKATKKTAAFHLRETHLKEIAKIAKQLKQSKSAVVDQLLAWGLERYRHEAMKPR